MRERLLRILLFLTVIFFMGNVSMARRNYLKNSRYLKLDSEGIKIRGFHGLKPAPLSSVKTFYVFKKSDPDKKIEVFKVSDIWRKEQICGRWTADGGTLTVAEMKYPSRKGIEIIKMNGGPDGLVFADVYEKWKAENSEKKTSPGNVKHWVKDFYGSGDLPDKIEEISCREARIYRFKMDSGVADIFLVKPEKSEKIYAFLFEYEKYSDIKKSLRSVLKSIKSISFFEPEKSSGKQLFANRRGELKNRTPEYLASREKVIENIKNLDSWWFAETKNYIFTANLESRKTINDFQEDIEKCRELYEKIFPSEKPFSEISVIKAFQERNEYVRYLGEAGSRSVGLWNLSTKELVISPVCDSVRKNRETMIRTLYHEGFHQYIHYAANEVVSAPWFNEGHATFFEGLEFKGNRKIKTAFSPSWSETFKRVNSFSATEKEICGLLKMDYRQYYDENRASENYALGWALVYFMYKGAPVMKLKKYSAIPLKYFKALLETENPEKATDIAWDGIDMGRFTKAFNYFWRKRRYIRKSLRYEPFED